MAEAVVDMLEPIDVAEGEAEGLAARRAFSTSSAKQALKEAPIADCGHDVAQPGFLGPLAIRSQLHT